MAKPVTSTGSPGALGRRAMTPTRARAATAMTPRNQARRPISDGLQHPDLTVRQFQAVGGALLHAGAAPIAQLLIDPGQVVDDVDRILVADPLADLAGDATRLADGPHLLARHGRHTPDRQGCLGADQLHDPPNRKSTRLNSSHVKISYAVFCL